MLPVALLFAAVGVLFIVAAIQNWDWFYLNKWFSDEHVAYWLFGENAARLVLGFSGVSIIAAAAWLYFSTSL